MIDDDAPLGTILTRREALARLGSAGVILMTGDLLQAGAPSGKPGCVVRPEQTEGPYFVDELLNRSDIRTDPSDGSVRPGSPLQVTFNVSRFSGKGCRPLADVLVDVWHCDHRGIYSGVEDPHFDTVGRKFLRGYQITDGNGTARFSTIYPGWYPGRTVHIHFKIRSAPKVDPGFDFTSQLYFDDELTDRVFSKEPYAGRGRRTVRNARDGIFRRGGEELLVPVTEDKAGYAAIFDVALDLGDGL